MAVWEIAYPAIHEKSLPTQVWARSGLHQTKVLAENTGEHQLPMALGQTA